MDILKSEVKDIARVLIAKSGEQFDLFAFGDCGDILTYDNQCEILNEIEKECKKVITKISLKYDVEFGNDTRSIIESILFE